MTKEEFGKWYRAHIDEMVAVGIMHPESEAGKWVKVALIAANSQYGPILEQMQKRIVQLEAIIHGEKAKFTPKQKQPVKEPEPIVEEPKIEVKVEKPKAKPKAKQKAKAEPKQKTPPKAKVKSQPPKQKAEINTKKPVKSSGWSV